jgi:hypothetical protein
VRRDKVAPDPKQADFLLILSNQQTLLNDYAGDSRQRLAAGLGRPLVQALRTISPMEAHPSRSAAIMLAAFQIDLQK